jgi:hypothetical protein
VNLWVTGGPQRWDWMWNRWNLRQAEPKERFSFSQPLEDQRSVMVDDIADELFRGDLSQGRVFV